MLILKNKLIAYFLQRVKNVFRLYSEMHIACLQRQPTSKGCVGLRQQLFTKLGIDVYQQYFFQEN